MSDLVRYITKCPKWRHHVGLTLGLTICGLFTIAAPHLNDATTWAALIVNAFWIWSD